MFLAHLKHFLVEVTHHWLHESGGASSALGSKLKMSWLAQTKEVLVRYAGVTRLDSPAVLQPFRLT